VHLRNPGQKMHPVLKVATIRIHLYFCSKHRILLLRKRGFVPAFHQPYDDRQYRGPEMQAGNDWRMVDIQPNTGYAEQRVGDNLFYGPLLGMTVEDEFPYYVRIQLKWVIKSSLDKSGNPAGGWAVVHSIPFEVASFPNEFMAYIIETTPTGLQRVRYGNVVLYIDAPEKIKASDIPQLSSPE